MALLGDMMLLGGQGDEVHRHAAGMIVNSKLDVLITVGERAQEIAKEALRLGFKGMVYQFTSFTGVRILLERLLDRNTILLIKGSMYNQGFARFAKALRNSKN